MHTPDCPTHGDYLYVDCHDEALCLDCFNYVFRDGDKIVGHYGNVWERLYGEWFLEGTYDSKGLSDATAHWLLTLKVQNAKIKTRKDRKISKTTLDAPPEFVYKYTLRRQDD